MSKINNIVNDNRRAITQINQMLSANNDTYDLFFEENNIVQFVIRDKKTGIKMIIAEIGNINKCNYYELNSVLMQVGSNLRFNSNIRNYINNAFISLLNKNNYYDLEYNFYYFKIKTTAKGKDYYAIDNHTKQLNRNKILSAIDNKDINFIRYFTKNKNSYEGVQIINRKMLYELISNTATQYRMLPDLDYASTHALWDNKEAWSTNTMKVVHEFNGEINKEKYYAKIRFSINNMEVDMHKSFDKKSLFAIKCNQLALSTNIS